MLIAASALKLNRMYLHERDKWTNFTWDAAVVAPLLGDARFDQGNLLGRVAGLGFSVGDRLQLDAVSQEVVASSRIEGQELDPSKVRSSVARQLGLGPCDDSLDTGAVDGAVAVMLDATVNFAAPLTLERLAGWHAALFPAGYSGLRRIAVGQLRTGPMQVVSGAIGHEKMHYDAPAANAVPALMEEFLAWFNENSSDNLLKAAIAHLWFLTIHPYDDGNGRMARALTEMLLARSDGSARRFYSMASFIMAHREDYYREIESAQKGTRDITSWLVWFLQAFRCAIEASQEAVSAAEWRDAWWRRAEGVAMNQRQRYMLQRLMGDFQGKLTSGKWAKMCKVSSDTALRDISDLVAKGLLEKAPGSGRSTSYHVVNLSK